MLLISTEIFPSPSWKQLFTLRGDVHILVIRAMYHRIQKSTWQAKATLLVSHDDFREDFVSACVEQKEQFAESSKKSSSEGSSPSLQLPFSLLLGTYVFGTWSQRQSDIEYTWSIMLIGLHSDVESEKSTLFEIFYTKSVWKWLTHVRTISFIIRYIFVFATRSSFEAWSMSSIRKPTIRQTLAW